MDVESHTQGMLFKGDCVYERNFLANKLDLLWFNLTSFEQNCGGISLFYFSLKKHFLNPVKN